MAGAAALGLKRRLQGRKAPWRRSLGRNREPPVPGEELELLLLGPALPLRGAGAGEPHHGGQQQESEARGGEGHPLVPLGERSRDHLTEIVSPNVEDATDFHGVAGAGNETRVGGEASSSPPTLLARQTHFFGAQGFFAAHGCFGAQGCFALAAHGCLGAHGCLAAQGCFALGAHG